MKRYGLSSLVLEDLRRSKRDFAMASIGIIVGIAAFVFFLSLGLGVRGVVLGDIFPLDKIEVVPRSLDIDLGPLRMGVGKDGLDDAGVEGLRDIPHVTRAFPKMKMTAPAIGKGGASLLGNDLYTEMIADSIEPALVEGEVDGKIPFVDRRDPAKTPQACSADAECEDLDWCAPRNGRRVCTPMIPVLASPHLVEIYNGTVRRAHNFPRLNPDFVVGLTFDLSVGRSMIKDSARANIREERCVLAGFSDKAIPLGATMPISYVREFNAEYGTPDDAGRYHSVVLQIDEKDNVASVARAVQDRGYDVADPGTEQAAMLIAIFMAVFGLVSVVVVAIAAINIMHVLLMLVSERQREFGIMRAVGATAGQIKRIVVAQSLLVGVVAGTLGVLLAVAMASLTDSISARYIPDFPYKPESLFELDPLVFAGAIVFSCGFCVLGALLPASRAAKIDPVTVLTSH